MFGLGGGEIILILFVILLLFGAKKLPELGKTLGKTIKGLQSASSEFQEEVNKVIYSEDDKNSE